MEAFRSVIMEAFRSVIMEAFRSVIMEAFRSVIMEAFRDQFTATELLAYKEVFYDEATEEWYAQHEREEHNCMRLALLFCRLMKEYRERFFTYVLFQSPTV